MKLEHFTRATLLHLTKKKSKKKYFVGSKVNFVSYHHDFFFVAGELISFQRSCSPVAFENDCLPGVDKANGGSVVRMCMRFCKHDGCNMKGYGALLLGNVMTSRK